MDFFALIIDYLKQPLWLVGWVALFLMYYFRLKRERKAFRVAVNKDCYEGRHFLKKGVLLFIILSSLSLLFGLMLDEKSLLIYQIISVVLVLFAPIGDTSLISLFLSGIVIYSLNYSGWSDLNGLTSSFLAMICLFLSGRLLLLHHPRLRFFSPTIRPGKRGRQVAIYTWREFSVFPLICLLPGDSLHSNLSFWPLFSINGQSFSLVVIPFFIGIACRVAKQSPLVAVEIYQRQTKILLSSTILLTIISLLIQQLTVVACLIVAILSLWQYYQRRALDKKAQAWYVETSDGVRVIAVQSNTPAAKMKIMPGDVILTCNGVKVADETQLYQALQQNAAYCKLKLRNFAGELKIAEGAIYNDSPHELGLILFR